LISHGWKRKRGERKRREERERKELLWPEGKKRRKKRKRNGGSGCASERERKRKVKEKKRKKGMGYVCGWRMRGEDKAIFSQPTTGWHMASGGLHFYLKPQLLLITSGPYF